MDEISEKYAMKHTSNSIKKITPKDDAFIDYSNNFLGYRMVFEATNFTKDRCL
jgi:hypothetical protein